MVGTRGVPARYGGFETAVEEVGRRLADRGHDVVVYCRTPADADGRPPAEHLGMRLVHLPAVRSKAAETLSHTAASVAHVARHGADVVLLFNAANACFLPVLRARRLPTAVHVDGLEWRRGKWGRAGRRWYLASERVAVRLADALISDAEGIAAYYRDTFDAASVVIPYGAPLLEPGDGARLAGLDLEPGGYSLVVARFEPENHVAELVEGYARSASTRPLVVVGGAPYADEYTRRVSGAAGGDPRVRLLGGIWDQEQLDQLYEHAYLYLHGHSVGGTNPSLLRAMGAGTSTLAHDNPFCREVLGGTGRYFADAADVAARVDEADAEPEVVAADGAAARRRAAEAYVWDDVADGYERLCEGLAARDRRLSGRG